MTRRNRVLLAILVPALAVLSAMAYPGTSRGGTASSGFTHVTTVTGPGVPEITGPVPHQWPVDLSAVFGHVEYTANEGAREVTRYDMRTGRLLAPLRPPAGSGEGFTGCQACESFDFSKSAPQGFVPAAGQLWVGNGNSHVERFSLATGHWLGAVDTGGTNRADEAATDGKTVVFTVPDARHPFLVMIRASTAEVVRRVYLPGVVKPGELEQPAWDARTQRWYVSVPETTARPGGEIAVLSQGGRLERTIAAGNCAPSGLAVNHAGGTMALGCQPGAPSLIMTLGGRVLARLPSVSGIDEVWSDRTAGVFDFGSFTGNGCQVVSWAGQVLGQIVPRWPAGFHACTSALLRWFAPAGRGLTVWKPGAILMRRFRF